MLPLISGLTGLPFHQGWMRCNALETGGVDHHCLFSSTSAEPPIILAKSSSRSIASGNWIQAGIFLWSVAQPQPVTDYEDAAAAAWSFIDAALAMVRDGGPQPRHLLIRQPGLLSLRFVSLKHAEETKSIASGPGKPRGGSVTTVRIARIAGRSAAERSAVTSRTWAKKTIGSSHDSAGGRRRKIRWLQPCIRFTRGGSFAPPNAGAAQAALREIPVIPASLPAK